MPTYDFVCIKCDHKDELIVPTSVKILDCPNCNSKETFERQFSPTKAYPNVVGGTDYQPGGKKNWKSRTPLSKQADILNSKKSPY